MLRRSLRHALSLGTTALIALGASGCAVVDTYGDSILDDNYSSGAVTRANIQDDTAGIGYRYWKVESGTTMAGSRAPHSYANPRALETGANAIVFSFGRNDAIDWARGVSGSYDSGAGVYWALNWMDRARRAGASCVVWVTPNAEASPDANVFEKMRDWQRDFSNRLASLGGTVYPDGNLANPIKLRLVSWGTIAARGGRDQGFGVHPNATGAAELGQAIRAQVKTCT
ncbi:MAG: hypothetical protein V9E83_12685 [Baekduia sp.]